MTKLGINPEAVIFQLKVSLFGIQPEIWRRLLIPGNMKLDMLHETIQGAMGWKDEHLHEFVIEGTTYGDPDNPPHGLFTSERGTKTKLKFLGLKPGDKFLYQYDFDKYQVSSFQQLINSFKEYKEDVAVVKII